MPLDEIRERLNLLERSQNHDFAVLSLEMKNIMDVMESLVLQFSELQKKQAKKGV